MDTLCLSQPQAKRILQLQQTHQTLLLKIQQKQQLITFYTRLIQTFDSLDPGIKHYFKVKLQTLVIKLTTPSSILSERSIMSKLKKTSTTFMTRSILGGSRDQSRSFLEKSGTPRASSRPETVEREIQDDSNVIQHEFKILQQIQQHKQQTIKSTLTSQQQMIAKRLKQRKEKGRRKSAEKSDDTLQKPLINKEELKRMQKDLTKKIKRMTARISQMESLKAFSQRLVENPGELESIRNEKGKGGKGFERIEEEEEEENSDKENM